MSRIVRVRPLARLARVSQASGHEPSRRPAPVAGLFVVTLFLSAGLLFCVQPMVARMALPLLGGAPAVWNTCMVFFQAALLGSYLYSHVLTTRCPVKVQAVVHGLILLTPLLVLPIAIRGATAASDPSANPIPWLLGTLATSVGLPFLVVATTAPLLQHWYASTGDRASGDPYFLYSASNLGSLVALLGYPLVVEPNVRLAWQGRLWGGGYFALVALVVACGLTAWRRGDGTQRVEETAEPETVVGWGRRLTWVALAFVPSSLMLGVTSYLTTDIAAIPLLWVIPLGLYLLSFTLVFARNATLSREMTAALMPPALMLLAWTLAVGSEPTTWLMALHLGVYFLIAMVCHGRLADDRPSPRHLTGFYLAMSIGGVLGGLFNAIVAPVVFDRVVEYPLVLGLSFLALPSANVEGTEKGGRLARGLLGLAFLGMIAGRLSGLDAPWVSVGTKLAAGLFAAIGFPLYRRRPAGLAAVGLALLLSSFLPAPGGGRVVWRNRDFFGVLAVTESDGDRRLIHGQTLHGRQNLDPAQRRVPLTYYHRTGPVGELFRAMTARGTRWTDSGRVGVVGLGVGSMAAYATPGQRWTFYEIDPAVERVARDPLFFTFLSDCAAGPPPVILGDARLRLREAPDGSFDLLVLDAFSSDAIPTHLLTREAVALYRAKLANGGLIAFHISNRYLNLAPVVAALALDAGLTCRVRTDLNVSAVEAAEGKSASIWAVLSKDDGDIGPIRDDSHWAVITTKPGDRPWSDDFSSLAPLLLGR